MLRKPPASRPGLESIKRLVIKIGSSSVFGKKKVNRPFLKDLANQISRLQKKGIDVVIVSSGAVSLGHWQLQWPKPFGQLSVPEKQGLAAVGQGILMENFRRIFQPQGLHIGQILLSAADMNRRDSYLHLRNAMETLIKAKVIPVLNENDSVAVEELLFGDNDTLAANVALMVNADLLVIFSDIDGFLIDGVRESWIKKIDTKILQNISGGTNQYGTGGMMTKIRAADLLMKNGMKCVIQNFNARKSLEVLLQGRDIGTLFFNPTEAQHWSGKKRWIALGKSSRGTIFVDNGAAAQLKKKGSSLLAIGIREIEGNFSMGDQVDIADASGVFARGLSHFSAQELTKIKGHHSSEFSILLGKNTYQTVVHRNNLVLLGSQEEQHLS